MSITTKICKAVKKMVQGLPRRCTPILYMDANSAMGQHKSKSGVHDIDTNICGQYGGGVENANGTCIRNMLEDMGMYLPTTHYPIEHSFVSGAHHTSKTIDFIAIPHNMQNMVYNAYTFTKSAVILQV